MEADTKPLPAEPLFDLFGAPITRQERKTRRNRRREVSRFWAEREARGHPPPEVVLDYYLQAAIEAGDKATAIDIAKAMLPYRLPRISAVMFGGGGMGGAGGVPRLRIEWGDEHAADAAPGGAGDQTALLAPLVSASDTPEP